MSEPINQIDGIVGASSYHNLQQKTAAKSRSETGKGTDQISSKYIVEGNSLIYESYDRHGKLISRVPWTPQPIDEKA